MDTQSYIKSLLEAKPLREPVVRDMIGSLSLPSGSRGLDAGCGIGLQCVLLAEEVGSSGHVTGVDVSAALLERGWELAKDAGLLERISFQGGDVASLPFDDNTFDWAWSSDCIGYGLNGPQDFLGELVRVVKPGGIVALSAWSSENLLPGYPHLEARLRATSAGIAPFAHGDDPETHFLRALSWFSTAGLTKPVAKVFAGSAHAPLEPGMRQALESLFEMRWPDVEKELSPEDQADFRRLCRPDSPDFILDLPDYYAFFTYTLFRGRVGLP